MGEGASSAPLLQSCRIYMSQGKNRIIWGGLVMIPSILMVSQKPETHFDEHLQVTMCGQKHILWGTL